jgi:hypothetical protein
MPDNIWTHFWIFIIVAQGAGRKGAAPLQLSP